MVAVSSRARRSTGIVARPSMPAITRWKLSVAVVPACRSLALTVAIHVSSRPGAARGRRIGSGRPFGSRARRRPISPTTTCSDRTSSRSSRLLRPSPQFVLLELGGVGEPGGMLLCDLDEPLQQIGQGVVGGKLGRHDQWQASPVRTHDAPRNGAPGSNATSSSRRPKSDRQPLWTSSQDARVPLSAVASHHISSGQASRCRK